MKNYFKKFTSYAVLPAILAGSLGIGNVYAKMPNRINIEDSGKRFSFEQPPEISVKQISLQPDIEYILREDSTFSKPSSALGAALIHLENIRPSYPESYPAGREMLESKIRELSNLRVSYANAGDPSDYNLKLFATAALDWKITPSEYEELPNGNYYVSTRVNDNHATFHNGIIVSVDHEYDWGKFVINEGEIAGEFVEGIHNKILEDLKEPIDKYNEEMWGGPETKENDIRKTTAVYIPDANVSEGIQNSAKEKEKMSKKKKGWIIGVIMGGLLGGYLLHKDGGNGQDNTTGGDEY